MNACLHLKRGPGDFSLLRRLRLLPIFAAALIASCLPAQDRTATLQRLRDLQTRCLDLFEIAGDTPLSDEELDCLEAAKVLGSDLADTDVRALRMAVLTLQFANTLEACELPYVVEFGRSTAGSRRSMASLLAFAMLQEHHFDEAASLLLARAATLPKDQRSYITWKFVDAGFAHRSDYARLRMRLSTAMLRRLDEASDEERQAIADVFDEAKLSEEKSEALRRRIEDQYDQDEKRRKQLAADPTAHERIWVEDRHGLRLVVRREHEEIMGLPARCELRLVRRATPDAPRRDWGALLAAPDDLPEMQRWLTEFAAAVEDPGKDLACRIGVVHVFPRPPVSHDDPLTERLEHIEELMIRAITSVAMARTVLKWSPSMEEQPRTRVNECTVDLLEAIRGAARRARLLSQAQTQQATLEQEEDTSILDDLDHVGSLAGALAEVYELKAQLRSPPAPLQRMRYQHTEKAKNGGVRTVTTGATWVRIGPGRLDTLEVRSPHVLGTGWTGTSFHLQSISRAALANATFEMDDGAAKSGGTVEGCFCLLVHTETPALHRRITSATDTRPGSLRAWRRQRSRVECGSAEERRALLATLKKFADERQLQP